MCLLAGFYGLLNLLFIQPTIACPGLAHSSLGLVLLQQTLIKKCFMGVTTGQSAGDIFPSKALSSNLTLVCVKMTENQLQSLVLSQRVSDLVIFSASDFVIFKSLHFLSNFDYIEYSRLTVFFPFRFFSHHFF